MITKIILSIAIVGGLAALYTFSLSKNSSTPACDHNCKSCSMADGCSSRQIEEE